MGKYKFINWKKGQARESYGDSDYEYIKIAILGEARPCIDHLSIMINHQKGHKWKLNDENLIF